MSSIYDLYMYIFFETWTNNLHKHLPTLTFLICILLFRFDKLYSEWLHWRMPELKTIVLDFNITWAILNQN